jgi:hypothetical protein
MLIYSGLSGLGIEKKLTEHLVIFFFLLAALKIVYIGFTIRTFFAWPKEKKMNPNLSTLFFIKALVTDKTVQQTKSP